MRPVLGAMIAAVCLLAACGGDDDSAPEATAPAATAVAQPTADPTEQALAVALSDLSGFVLQPEELPAGFRGRRSQAIGPREIAVANIAIPRLAAFFDTSDLEGAWVAFFTRDAPESGISSIAFSFATPQGAQAYLDILSTLTKADYPVATSVEIVPAETVGTRSVAVIYRLEGSRTVEVTWTQGALAGQVMLRYAGDVGGPEDIELVVRLARIQAGRMAAGAQ